MNNVNSTPSLVMFGQDFEKHGGLRAFALASMLNDEDPCDCLNEMMGTCEKILGKDLAEEGMANEDDLNNIHGACYDLRFEYGRGVWIRDALVDYLHCVKGLKDQNDARKAADAMIAASEARYAPIRTDFQRRQSVFFMGLAVGRMKRMAEEMKKLAAESRETLRKM